MSVVYLTQELVEGAETRLVPVVAYPEMMIARQSQGLLQLPQIIDPLEPEPRLMPDTLLSPDQIDSFPDLPQAETLTAPPNSFSTPPKRAALVTQRQVVLPLIHESAVLGLLVTERSDRSWNEWEQSQIQQIAETLAIACVLDQRYQWLSQRQRQQRLLQAQQHDILDNLLHQFRNSLTALQTFSKLILKRLIPGDANRDIAASITREAARLRELSEQLEQAATHADDLSLRPLSLPPAWVDVGSVDSEQAQILDPPPLLPSAGVPGAGVLTETPLTLEPTSIVAVLEPLLASAAAIAQERHLSLRQAIPPDLPLVQANAQALREVLNNLLENALKYTQPSGMVSIRVSVCPMASRTTAGSETTAGVETTTGSEATAGLETKAGVEIAINDTGPGIPPQDMPHIFERRFRGIQMEGKIPGSGLGLAIAHSLVEQMHGKIQVISPAEANHPDDSMNSEELNQRPGTTFTVWLPLATDRI